jgi:hypothetical protein
MSVQNVQCWACSVPPPSPWTRVHKGSWDLEAKMQGGLAILDKVAVLCLIDPPLDRTWQGHSLVLL